MRQDLTNPDMFAQLKPTQQAALLALLAGSTITATAEEVGVSRATVSHWHHHDPTFQSCFRELRTEQKEAIKAKAGTLVEKALGVIGEHLEPGVPERYRLRAAELVMPMATRGMDAFAVPPPPIRAFHRDRTPATGDVRGHIWPDPAYDTRGPTGYGLPVGDPPGRVR